VVPDAEFARNLRRQDGGRISEPILNALRIEIRVTAGENSWPKQRNKLQGSSKSIAGDGQKRVPHPVLQGR